jgi:hypothetical protein
MITVLMEMVAADHRTELRHAAERDRQHLATRPQPTSGIEIRYARPADAETLRRLAALDEALPLDGPALLALADGRPTAAIALADRRIVADPFVPTAHIAGLLRARADQLTEAHRRRRPRWRLPRLRLA